MSFAVHMHHSRLRPAAQRSADAQGTGAGLLTVPARIVTVNNVVVAHGPGIIAVVEIHVDPGQQGIPVLAECPSQFAARGQLLPPVAVIALFSCSVFLLYGK